MGDAVAPEKLTVPLLRAQLQSRGLSTDGLKAALVARLTQALREAPLQDDTSDMAVDATPDSASAPEVAAAAQAAAPAAASAEEAVAAQAVAAPSPAACDATVATVAEAPAIHAAELSAVQVRQRRSRVSACKP
jgi:hypothetical protein